MGYRTEYDEIYNRTSMTRADMPVKLPAAFTNDPAYNAANRLTTFNSNSVSHDLNGNMTSWGSTAYTWDEFNRLVAVNGTSLDASYKYDALGRRIEKTINGTTTRYLYDGADIILEMDGSNVATAYYIRTLDIDEPLARIELDSGGNVTGIRFYLADALGSTIALTDENGDIKTRYNYTPFGEPEVSGDTSDNPFMFTGREYDDGTGLYYYRARYYSWELGRFISEDPIGLAGGINFYSYVGNSPLNFVDPLGLMTFAFGTTDYYNSPNTFFNDPPSPAFTKKQPPSPGLTDCEKWGLFCRRMGTKVVCSGIAAYVLTETGDWKIAAGARVACEAVGYPLCNALEEKCNKGTCTDSRYPTYEDLNFENINLVH